VAAAGSAYAWKKHHDAVKQRHKIAASHRSVKYTRKYKGGYYDRNGKWHSTVRSARR
jgi:hypothetical protein